MNENAQTEAEMKEKWCPHARVSFLGANVANRVSTFSLENSRKEAARTGDDRDLRYFVRQQLDTFCIGSKCSQWRWVREPSGTIDQPSERGYCGLAGDP